MSLIKCPDCGKDVSAEATVCPHCGPISNRSMPSTPPTEEPVVRIPPEAVRNAKETPPPIQDNPSPTVSAPLPDKKIDKGCQGCLWVIAGSIVLLILVSITNPKTEDTAHEAARQLAGPNNQVVKRINSLSSANAYRTGYSDGVNEASVTAQRPETRSQMQNMAGLKNAIFDLIAEVKSTDANTLSEYRRGWNDGWTEIQRAVER